MARNRQRARDRKLRRDNVPGELQHASGEVDEAEAAIVSGADGEVEDFSDAELLAQEEAAGPAEGVFADEVEAPRSQRVGGPKPKGNRVLNFLRASWAELQRVQWPDRRQVAQATAVVIGFVVVAGAYLGAADWAAQRLVNFII
jgi:preprotein translocase subunit SecE